jgi:nickel superoxide dismutase
MALVAALVFIPEARSHCQVPCGIYDDEMRFEMIAEHIKTIEKSMKQIVALGKRTPANHNQIVRWVNNKDHHADEIIDIVSNYFLAQRIKPLTGEDEKASHVYSDKLAILHGIIFHAMKAKQTTNLSHVTTMKTLLEDFRKVYFSAAGVKHR